MSPRVYGDYRFFHICQGENGAGGGIRIPIGQLRRLLHYPVILRQRSVFITYQIFIDCQYLKIENLFINSNKLRVWLY